MKNKNLKLLFLASILSLSSCGYGYKNVIDNKYDHSSKFQDNFYSIWDKRLKKVSKVTTHNIEEEKIPSWTSYNDDNFYLSDPDARDMTYHRFYYDIQDNETTRYYENNRKLSLYDASFKYGFISKLFDGQVDCYGTFQGGRIQIDENGFGSLFTKELYGLSEIDDRFYFSLSYKPVVHQIEGSEYDSDNHRGKLNLKVGFVIKNSEGYTVEKFIYPLEYEANTLYFVGFSLSKFDLTRCSGITFEYEHISNEFVDINSDYGVYLFLYEMFLPFTIWH